MEKSVLDGSTQEEPSRANPSSNSGTRARPNRPSTTSTPRWVIGLAIIFIILVLLFVIMHFAGMGFSNHIQISSLGYWVQQL